MRVVLDTNVLISGLFFGGVPGRINKTGRCSIALEIGEAYVDFERTELG